MAILIKNNAVSKLAGSIDPTQTTLSVTSGEGDKFPTLSADDWFPLTIEQISGGTVTREVVHCTGRVGDTLTVIRGQEGFSKQSFSAGDRVEIRFTQRTFELLAQTTDDNGSLVIPEGTTAQRDSSPTNKLIRFNTDTGLYEGYNGSQWLPVGSGATGGGGDQVFVLNDQAMTSDYTIPTGKNASLVGPLTIPDGVDLTIPDGSNVVIL